ncbi:MAG: aspartate carbamoyltransferase catalytic subunit [Phycisphaerae bacterium]|nr:aspartate carbamoyltransferase catalytic subunit [Phycisphaerae bacterium]
MAARHCLQLEGLSAEQLTHLLDSAEELLPVAERASPPRRTLEGKLVAQLFFEDSTRTRLSFETAVARLGGRSISLSESGSSASKGETFLDTALNVEALGVDAVVVRSALSGGAELLSRHLDCSILNAGDGRHEHPTQGLLDCLTIRRALGKLKGARIAIVGDIANSRVARSALHALTALGAHVRLVGPPTLLPQSFAHVAKCSDHVVIAHELDSNLGELDAIMMLRIQVERAAGSAIASDYRLQFGLTRERASRLPDHCVVLHPGPVNRGVEVDDDVADDARRSQILRQVTHGVAVRMAVLQHCLVNS